MCIHYVTYVYARGEDWTNRTMEGGSKPKKNEDTQNVQKKHGVTHEITENLYE